MYAYFCAYLGLFFNDMGVRLFVGFRSFVRQQSALEGILLTMLVFYIFFKKTNQPIHI